MVLSDRISVQLMPDGEAASQTTNASDSNLYKHLP